MRFAQIALAFCGFRSRLDHMVDISRDNVACFIKCVDESVCYVSYIAEGAIRSGAPELDRDISSHIRPKECTSVVVCYIECTWILHKC